MSKANSSVTLAKPWSIASIRAADRNETILAADFKERDEAFLARLISADPNNHRYDLRARGRG